MNKFSHVVVSKYALARRLVSSQYSMPKRRDTSRPVGSMKFGLAGLILFLMALTGTTLANDPPRVIARIYPVQGSRGSFAQDFVCVGDQNGDGFDDLLLNHDIWRSGVADYTFLNRIDLYYGGPRMDNQPDFVIRGSNRDSIQFGSRINFVGHLTTSENPYWAVQTVQETADNDIRYSRIYVYEAGDALDTIPEFVIDTGSRSGGLGIGRRSMPCDINGDGFNDIVSVWQAPYYDDPAVDYLEIRFGGEEFDVEPDVRFVLEASLFDVSLGYDVNRDGYDDMLVRYRSFDPEIYLIYNLYLGGEQFDTVATLSIPANHFDPGFMSNGFVLVPDVNGDRYDDWVINCSSPSVIGQPNTEAYFLFFGSEEPDATPDSILEAFHSLDDRKGEVIGGDINGDHFGDIIVSDMGGYRAYGEAQIFFGSRWMSGEPGVDINGRTAYANVFRFGMQVGAIGEYDGDGVKDFALLAGGGGYPPAPETLMILAGNRNWEVSVQNESNVQKSNPISLFAAPNPFNDRLTVHYSIPGLSELQLGVYDINGRLISLLSGDKMIKGQYSVNWSAPYSGVFLIVLSTNPGMQSASREVIKVVCLK